MATSLKILEKEGPIDHAIQYLPYGAKIVKIGQVDPEIALLSLKKRKKLTQAKYIAQSAGLPSRLN